MRTSTARSKTQDESNNGNRYYRAEGLSPLLPMLALCIHSERPEYKHLQMRLTRVFFALEMLILEAVGF
jgi:hypothetical protein